MRIDTKAIRDKLKELGYPKASVVYKEIQESCAIHGDIHITVDAELKDSASEWCRKALKNPAVTKSLDEVGCEIFDQNLIDLVDHRADELWIVFRSFGKLSDYLGNQDIGVHHK